MWNRFYLVVAILLVAIRSDPTVGAESHDKYSNIHTVAIISDLGNDLEMQSISVGLTGITPSQFFLHTDWNLDSDVVDDIRKALAGRFRFREPAVDPHVFDDIQIPAFGGYEPEVKRRVLTLPKANGIDAYIIIFADPSPYLGPPGHALVVTRSPGLFGAGETDIQTYYLLEVIDATTGERIDYSSARIPSPNTFSGHQTPIAQCSNEMWADNAEQLTSDQKMWIRQEMESLISRSIAYTLAGAGLVGEADSIADTEQFAMPAHKSCKEGLH